MDKRRQLIRRNKNAEKNLIKREQDYAYKFLVFCMIAGIVNWIFWHDQFIGLDTKHTIVFIILPLIVGLFVYYRMNKFFVKSILKSKSSGVMDRVFSNFFLFVIGLFFAYFCVGTLADVIFKLTMDFSVRAKPAVNKTYIVTSTSKNNKGRGYHFFSHARYIDESGEKQTFDVKNGEVETSDEKRKITFQCKEGFWGYYKITGYAISN